MRRPSTHDDRGQSLIELLVALGIMATAVIALVGGIATSIRLSDLHRRQTVAGTYVKAFAETLQRKVAESQDAYVPCGPAADPATSYAGYYSVPAAESTIYRAQVVKVTYWDSDAQEFKAACPASGDYGVQLVSLQVIGLDNSRATVSETLDVSLRKPCAPLEPACS
jgi:Tfp pilus assembly protein PilV